MGKHFLTEKGRDTAVGVVSAICHGYDLEQVAALNGLENADAVRVMLLMVLVEADIVSMEE